MSIKYELPFLNVPISKLGSRLSADTNTGIITAYEKGRLGLYSAIS